MSRVRVRSGRDVSCVEVTLLKIIAQKCGNARSRKGSELLCVLMVSVIYLPKNNNFIYSNNIFNVPIKLSIYTVVSSFHADRYWRVLVDFY